MLEDRQPDLSQRACHSDPPQLSLSAFSVVIPVFNEEEGITTTLDRLQKQLKGVPCPYEIVVVNDGSTDRSGLILRDRTDIRLVEHGTNLGYGAALKTGIRVTQHPLVVITDADGTYPNDRIPDLVAAAAQADMVVGARIGSHSKYPTIRKIPKWFLVQFAQWLTKTKIPDLNSGLRVFRKSVVERFLSILPDTFSFTTTITIALLTNRYIVRYVPIDYYPRLGKSKIKPIRDTLRFIQLILRTGIYFAPLRVFLPIAGVFYLASLITLYQDVFDRRDLTERTLIMFVTATQIGLFALLADMIDKRSERF
ncbi:glycosyltransferase family 2 protein [Trichothermofontia sp.]